MCNNKGILKILIPILLIAGFFIFSPQYIAFADDSGPPSTEITEEETPIENEAEPEVIKEEPSAEEPIIEKPSAEEPSSEEPVIEVKTNENFNTESKLITENEVKTETESQVNTTTKELTTPIENIKTEPTNNSKALPKKMAKANNSTKQNTNTTNNKSTSNEVEVGTAEEFNLIVTDLNSNGGLKTIKLKNDLAITNQNSKLRNGTLTILGEGHILTLSITVTDNGTLNLGQEGYEKALDMLAGKSDLCIVNVEGQGTLNIYKGVTIRDCTRFGQAGGIQAVENSTVNMYGGTIKNCRSYAVSGGIYLDGHAEFNMYNGKIIDCRGSNGGAIGLSGGSAIGSSTAGPVTFNMYGGTISNCIDDYYGGGAICAYSWYPITVNIEGGKIENCKTTATSRYSYGGGAISIFCFSDLTFTMSGGEIINCSCVDNPYGYGGAILIYSTGQNTNIQLIAGKIVENNAIVGGGFFLYKGTATIGSNFELYNNVATEGGDDFYNAFGKFTLYPVSGVTILNPCNHLIDGWYEDADMRWSYEDCTGEAQYLVEFTDLGATLTNQCGLKAAHGLNPQEPVEPVDPVDPVDPIDPIDPVDPINPIDPVNPIDPINPIVPVNPINPINPPEFTSDITPLPIIDNTGEVITYIIIYTYLPSNNFTATGNNTITIETKTIKPIEIKEPTIPLGTITEKENWALINLLIALITFIIGLFLIIVYFIKNNKDKFIKRIISIAIGIISIIIFFLTENINLSMTLVDKWTPLMAIILIINIVLIFFPRKEKE